MYGAYLGPTLHAERHRAAAQRRLARSFHVLAATTTSIDTTAQALAAGKAVGWFQGRMEFGPRALGARSILGDPRSPTMQKTLNLKVKYRESFRPFAPAVLREDVADWFELDADSPLHAAGRAGQAKRHRRSMTRERAARCSASTSSTCRAPTFRRSPMSTIRRASRPCIGETNPRFHALISRFKAMTGCPVLVNTSFNVRGEPIVCTPEDAFRCFMGTEIEMLAVGNCILRKDEQNPALRQDYKDAFELD